MGIGTPSQQVIRKEPLTGEECKQLVQEHISRLKKVINRLDLCTLGDLRCLPIRDMGVDMVLKDFEPDLSWDPDCYRRLHNMGMSIKGIFAPVYERGQVDELPEGKQFIWGYARPGKWMLVELEMYIEKRYAGGHDASLAKTLTFHNSTLNEICELVPPIHILQKIYEGSRNAELSLARRLTELQEYRQNLRMDIVLARKANGLG